MPNESGYGVDDEAVPSCGPETRCGLGTGRYGATDGSPEPGYGMHFMTEHVWLFQEEMNGSQETLQDAVETKRPELGLIQVADCTIIRSTVVAATLMGGDPQRAGQRKVSQAGEFRHPIQPFRAGRISAFCMAADARPISVEIISKWNYFI
jgi:hypothetical protein